MRTGKVLVIGAGVGGLMAALALKASGINVSVYERTSELACGGAAITLWSNATRILAMYGVLDELCRCARPIAEAHVLTERGQTLARIPCEGLAKRYGAPILCVTRRALLAALYHALGNTPVHFGTRVVDVVNKRAEATLHFENGTAETGDLVIAADGIHSVVREKLVGDALRYSGYTAWRGIANIELDLNRKAHMLELWGRGVRFGLAPVSKNSMYWFATENALSNSSTFGNARAHLLDLAQSFIDPLTSVISASSEEAILHNDIYDRAPIYNWIYGRIALLGDAAHPTTPNLGQGACLAIEDAAVLGSCLRSVYTCRYSIETALNRYQTIRLGRANRVVRLSAAIGRIGQFKHPVPVGLRNLAVRLTPFFIQQRNFDAVAGYQIQNIHDAQVSPPGVE